MTSARPHAKHPIRTSDLATVMGWSSAYASQLLTGIKAMSIPLALRILDETGHKLGPIRHATDSEIATLRKFARAF